MEIVLAILLFFGGITLGSVTADKGSDELESTRVIPSSDSALELYPVTQMAHHSDLMRCHSGKSVIYRDLTIPYHSKIAQPVNDASDCDGECPDE